MLDARLKGRPGLFRPSLSIKWWPLEVLAGGKVPADVLDVQVAQCANIGEITLTAMKTSNDVCLTWLITRTGRRIQVHILSHLKSGLKELPT